MPVLSNPRHERFAQLLASGRTADDAYVEAGFKRDRGNASHLTAKDSVRARVAELQAETVKDAKLSLDWLVNRAEEARQGAMAAGQHSAAVAAIKEIGVLTGLRVEKRENGAPGEFDGMDADDIRRAIAERLGRLGLLGARGKPH